MRTRYLLINAALAAATTLLMSQSAQGQPTTSRFCTDALIKGTYGFVVEGEILVIPPPGLVKGIAMTTFDGKGALTQIDSTSVNGNASASFSTPATGTYSVNTDCTGTFSIVFGDGRPAVTTNFVVTTGGFEIDTVVVGVCNFTDNASPPCKGQGMNSVRSIGKRRFVGFGD